MNQKLKNNCVDIEARPLHARRQQGNSGQTTGVVRRISFVQFVPPVQTANQYYEGRLATSQGSRAVKIKSHGQITTGSFALTICQ